VEAAWAADEGVSALVETKEAVGGAGDTDARTLAEEYGGAGNYGACGRGRTARNGCLTVLGALVGSGGARGDGAEPEGAGGAEVDAVECAVDAQGGGEAAWTAG
jgi:hypothetical protein